MMFWFSLFIPYRAHAISSELLTLILIEPGMRETLHTRSL